MNPRHLSPPARRTARRRGRALAVLAALAALVGSTLALAGPAAADEVVAADSTGASAADPAAAAPAGVISAPPVTAAAALPRGIVVTNHAGRPVELFAKGELIRRVQPTGPGRVVFTGLSAGRTYTVEVAGLRIGSLTAVDRPAPASGLVVRRGTGPGSVDLAWQHRASVATGGRAISYLVAARATGVPPLRMSVTGQRTAHLEGLDRSVRYTFTVVPRNSAGSGRATRATMARPLGPDPVDGPAPTVAAPAPAIAQPVAPTTPAAPAAPSQPTTRTIYVCPDGYAETATRQCVKRLPYTFQYRAYTFHAEATGPAPIVDSYVTTVRACPPSHNLEDYGWVMYCRRYGPEPNEQVLDDPPTGFTDDGTQWVRRDDPPTGFTDDGTQWVRTVDRQAVVVPA